MDGVYRQFSTLRFRPGAFPEDGANRTLSSVEASGRWVMIFVLALHACCPHDRHEHHLVGPLQLGTLLGDPAYLRGGVNRGVSCSRYSI